MASNSTLPPSARLLHLWPKADQIERLTREAKRRENQQEEKRKVKLSLSRFVEKTSNIKLDHWQFDLCERLESLARTTGRRLLICAPPQYGKSVIVSQRFPAWLLSEKPDHRIKLAAYNITHATSFGKIIRDILQSEEFAALNPGPLLELPKVTSAESWSTLARLQYRDSQPSFKALGLATGFVGQGCDCFTAETLIKTEKGEISIEQLHRENRKPLIYAFDHKTGQVVLKKIKATREIEVEQLVEVSTKSGRKFRCTADHRIYVADVGYIAAETLSEGATLSVYSSEMRLMSEGFLAKEVGLSKASAERLQRCLLFSRLLKGASRGKERRKLQSLRQSQKEQFLVLLRSLSGRIQKALEKQNSETGKLQSLRRFVSACFYPFTILFLQLCRSSSLAADAGQGQFSLQERNELQQMVRRDEAVCNGQGQSQVRCLSNCREISNSSMARPVGGENESTGSPYKSRPAKQYAGEFDYPLQKMPPQAPRVSSDSVSMVQRLRKGRVKVYDIQVEDCHNFFAEGVLVHNCLIIDDPYASPEEAYSETINAKVHSFWSDTAKPRLNEKTNVVVMFHRYQEYDLAGWLMEQEPDEWELIRYSAVADGEYRHPVTERLYQDPLNRKEGEKLSERFSDAWLASQQQNTFVWLSQFQGRPTTKGGLYFKSEWFEIVGAVPANSERVRYWDKAGADEGKGDFTVGVLMAKAPNGLFYVEDVERGQWTAHPRNEKIKQTAELDRQKYGNIKTYVEQPPGLAKESTDTVIKLLAGFSAYADPVRGDKSERAEPFKAQCEAGNVKLIKGEWNRKYIDEMSAFPAGRNDDQVDGSSGAFNKLTITSGWSEWA
jgi:predicted phage terminase large subunit-like protein